MTAKKKPAKVVRGSIMADSYSVWTDVWMDECGYKRNDRIVIMPASEYRRLKACERRVRDLEWAAERNKERQEERQHRHACACGQCNLDEPTCPVIRAARSAKYYAGKAAGAV